MNEVTTRHTVTFTRLQAAHLLDKYNVTIPKTAPIARMENELRRAMMPLDVRVVA